MCNFGVYDMGNKKFTPILVGEFAEKFPVQDRQESRTICAWIRRKWIRGRKMVQISLSPVTYFSTTDIKLQIPLPQCLWHK